MPAGFDGLVIPGGWAPDKMRRDPDDPRRWCATSTPAGCRSGSSATGAASPSRPASSAARATGSLGIKDDLVNAGAEWVDEPAFRDGTLVWGRVVADIPDFTRELIARLVEAAGS